MFCCTFICATYAFAQTSTYYTKVRTAPEDWSGEYLIVKEVDSISTGIVFNGSLSDLDEKHNCFRVSISSDDRIALTPQTEAAAFTIRAKGDGTYYVISHSGYYIGYNKADSANLKYDTTPKYANTIRMESDTTTKVLIIGAGGYRLRYNQAPESDRFRYYAEGKKKGIHLYKKITTTGLGETEKEYRPAIDGSLYGLPEGFWLIDGKVVFIKPE